MGWAGKTGKKMTPSRLIWYRILSGEHFFGIPRHNNLHLYGKRNVWFIYPYKKVQDAQGKRDNDSKRILGFWEFMAGQEKDYAYFYAKYVDAVRQVLWMTRSVGNFEIAVIPGSSPEKVSVLETVCRDIVEKERFLLGRAIDGSDLLRRKWVMTPVHKGGVHSSDDIARSLQVTRPLKCKKVILLDDLVFSGKTDLACRKLLKEAGAEDIYTICMYGHKRPER